MLTIVGPTATGKTGVAVAIARELGAEILSGDSRQIYRAMTLGTGKDLSDYTEGGPPVPYHLIDIANPGEKYSIFSFQHDFLRAYRDICARGRLPMLVGGSGLYVESVLQGYRMTPVPQNEALRESLRGKTLEELTLDEYKNVCEVFDEGIYDAINLENCVNGRKVRGGPAKESVERQIGIVDNFLKAHK